MQAINIGCRRELFADDYLIEQMTNVRFDLKHPERHEIIVFDAPWEDRNAFPYSVVKNDDGIIRLYYRASILEIEEEEKTIVAAIMESTDNGITFVRPKLGLHEYNGSRHNNILSIGLPGTPPPFIDTNPHCPTEERYKGLMAVSGRLYAFCSKDGIQWRKMQDEPLAYPGAFDTINTAFWDSIVGCYRSYTRAWVNRKTKEGLCKFRIIQSATSPDFIHWSKPIDNIYADGEEEVHLYTNATQPCPGAEHIYVAFPCRFMERRRRCIVKDENTVPNWPRSGCNDGLFMASRDGIHWTRYLDAWIRPGLDARNWTHRNNYPVWGIIPVSETEWVMYVTEHYDQPDMPARLRRLSLRPHGFVSVHAHYCDGEFITKPLIFEGHRLRLNYATAAAGSIKIEVQDINYKPFSGFTMNDMEPLFGDEIDGGVTWKNKSNLAYLAGKQVRLRFVMKDADIFAMRFTSEERSVSRCEIVPLQLPTYRTEATCSEIRIPPVSCHVVIDGDTSEWDFSNAITIVPPDEFADDYNAKVALMYDNNALYIAGKILDPFPMINTNSFDSDMKNSWTSDALQLHLRAVTETPNADINDIRLWYSTKDKKGGCYIIYGIDDKKGVLNPAGVEGAYKRRPDGRGYAFEYKIPWTALNSTRAPQRGERLTCCIQCHWGTEKGDQLLCGAVNVRIDSFREAYEPQSWGWAVFE